MNLLLGSLKGAPGVTTLAVLLAHHWHRDRILIEADLSGGILAGRYGLSPGSPGLLNLVTGCRRNMESGAVHQACQQLPGGSKVVVSTGRKSTVQSLLEEIPLTDINQMLPDTDLIFDLGRIEGANCPASFLAASDVLVLLVHPCFEQLDCLLSQLTELTSEIPAGVVLCGSPSHFSAEYSEAEVDSAVRAISNDRAEVIASLPYDSRAAEICAVQGPAHKAVKKSFLGRSVMALSQNLKTRYRKKEAVSVGV